MNSVARLELSGARTDLGSEPTACFLLPFPSPPAGPPCVFYHQSRAHPLLEASGGRCALLGGHGPRCLVSCLCGASAATSGVRDPPRDPGLFGLSAGRARIASAAGPSRQSGRPCSLAGCQGWVGPGFPLFSTHAAAAFVAAP